MRKSTVAAALSAALALTALSAPIARADLSRPAAITGGSIVSGGDLVLGPDSRTTFMVSFTATDDSGISAYSAEANLLGPNGRVLSPDPGTGPRCKATSATTSICRFFFTVDTGSAQIGNAHAGLYRLWGLAVPNDWDPATGEGLVSRANLATVRIQRRSHLTVDALPEPVLAGRSISVFGRLTFADWDEGGYSGEPGHPVRLVFRTPSSPTYQYVQSLNTLVSGLVATTTVAVEDGWWWLTYPGTEATSWTSSAEDYVDVR
ncbi:hypothetical protein [Streptomyces sp. NPDC006879]|uniref:hypothetical protein n=1 Tax=Streptomyces sp. NPDC006879 TaxID=3364767 RepID=UPI0036C4C2DF